MGFNWHTSLVFLGEGSSPRSSIGAIPRLCCRLSWQIHTLVGKVLPEPIVEQRLACLRDASLPPNEFVPEALQGMFSESATKEVREELASIMSDFLPVGFRLMAMASAQVDTRDLLPNIQVPTLLIWVMRTNDHR